MKISITFVLLQIIMVSSRNNNRNKNNLKNNQSVTSINETKVIRIWNRYHNENSFGPTRSERGVFDFSECKVSNCIMNYRQYQHLEDSQDAAILFHIDDGISNRLDLPVHSLPNQLFVFMSLEPPVHLRWPEKLSNLMDLTMTYRLDSDIPSPYFAIVDKGTNKTVAPSLKVSWKNPKPPKPGSYLRKEINDLIKEKEDEAVWIATNCDDVSQRQKYVRKIRRYGVQVDVHGRCGPTGPCRGDTDTDCSLSLGRSYYFYLVFENALCEDYMSDKVVKALYNGAVPVVLSGANVDNFLPPGSYLDVRSVGPKKAAEMMRALMDDPEAYARYFSWRRRYRVERRGLDSEWPAGEHPLCQLCEILHQPTWRSSRKVKEVHRWWQTSRSGNESACVGRDTVRI